MLGEEKDGPRVLTVLSLNILAPCYKRLPSRLLEHNSPALAKARLLGLAALLAESNSHVICLQEYWFDDLCHEVFAQFTKDHSYSIYLLQRTRDREDGCCILVKQIDGIEVLQELPMRMFDVGDRVCLFLRIQLTWIDGNRTEILLGNLHLTFPHSDFDRKLRAWQIGTLLRFVEDSTKDKPCPVFLCGDFNGMEGGLEEHLIKAEFESVPGVRSGVITHRNHRKEDVLADYFWFRGSVSMKEFKLLPETLLDTKWPSEKDYSVSDHRPLFGCFDLDKTV